MDQTELAALRIAAREDALAKLKSSQARKAQAAVAAPAAPLVVPSAPVKRRGRPRGSKNAVPAPIPVETPANRMEPDMKSYIKKKLHKYIDQHLNRQLALVALMGVTQPVQPVPSTPAS